jgi:hypothetical protein
MSDERERAVRVAATSALLRKQWAVQLAELVRGASGRRWVGVYEVTSTGFVNLAWSGPTPPDNASQAPRARK